MCCRVYFLSCPRTRQLYRVERLHPPGHSIRAAVCAGRHDETDTRSSRNAGTAVLPPPKLDTEHRCRPLRSPASCLVCTGFISQLGDALSTLRFVVAFLRPYRQMPRWYTVLAHVVERHLISNFFFLRFFHFALLTYSHVGSNLLLLLYRCIG